METYCATEIQESFGKAEGQAMSRVDEVLDDALDAAPLYGMNAAPEYVMGVRSLQSRCVGFNLSVKVGHPILQVAYDYGEELATNIEGVKMPYGACMFYGRIMDSDELVLVSDSNCPPGYSVSVTAFEKMDHTYPISGRWAPTVNVMLPNDPDLKIIADYFPIVQLAGQTKEKLEEMAREVQRMTITIYGLLNMKHFQKVTNEPSERVNKKRAENGLAPLKASVHVSLSPRVVSAYRGGTHNSPRPHWRRGHVRHMANGKIVNVQPHMVMGDAPKRDYEVKA